MSTHNIGFYEELTKTIFQLLSNIPLFKSYEADRLLVIMSTKL